MTIPKTKEECFALLDKELSDEDKRYLIEDEDAAPAAGSGRRQHRPCDRGTFYPRRCGGIVRAQSRYPGGLEQLRIRKRRQPADARGAGTGLHAGLQVL